MYFLLNKSEGVYIHDSFRYFMPYFRRSFTVMLPHIDDLTSKALNRMKVTGTSDLEIKSE